MFKGEFKPRTFSLALEQYYIFTLNPVLNDIKVAGASPGGPMAETTKLSIKTALSKPLYVYNHDKSILHHTAQFSSSFLKEINMSKSTLFKYLASGEALYGKLIFSRELLPGVDLNLMDTKNLSQILAEGRSATIPNYKSPRQISITLIDFETQKECFLGSLRSASNFTKSFAPNDLRYIGKDKLVKMNSGDLYKGWIVRKE